ncbi:MAG: efflux RND transporter periplasmic adaptor subunit [Pseudomonadota bacterium]
MTVLQQMDPSDGLGYRARRAGIVMGALVLMAGLAACGKKEQAAGGPPAMPPLPVSVVEVQVQKVPTLIEAVGQVEGSKDVQIHARVSGILEKRHYQEGATAKAGDVLFSIERTPFEIALEQARAGAVQAKANLEQAKREAGRLQPLVTEKAVSQKELDDATSTFKTAEAAVTASQAAVRNAELNLSYTKVTAPISGVTGRAQYSEGNLIAASGDASLLTTMQAVDPIWVRFSFSESELSKLRQAGGKTRVNLILPDGGTYDVIGKLNFTASTIDPKTGTVAMRAEFANPKLSLLPGQFIRVQAAVGEREAYLVPQAAVSQTEQGKVLFTVSANNTVEPKPVETAGWLGHDWIVTKGLTPGDKVITNNLMKLRPGAPVAPAASGSDPAQPATK